MPRFFCTDRREDSFYMDRNDSFHMRKSLRMKDGDTVTVCDTEGFDYECSLSFDEDGNAVCRILSRKENDTEPSVRFTLYQAMPKKDKLETIIQKSVEIGVSEIVPLISNRCISRPDRKAAAKKNSRYNKIALSASKQSGRGTVPPVRELMSFDEAIKELSRKQLALVFYENGGESLESIDYSKYDEIGILIGSEGGFDLEEIRKCEELGIRIMSLGKRILRCETAPLVALSALMLLTGNLE